MSRNPRIRFCQNNMLQASGAVLTASGAVSGFPISYLIDPYRYRCWIPPGTFVITTANWNIPINDGSDWGPTVAVGTYTYATLATAIQTALNSVSSGWTCTYDYNGGSFRFTIAKASGTATLRCTLTSSAIWDTIGFSTVSNRTGSLSYTADQQRNHTSEWVTIDLGAPKAPLCFNLIGAADSIFPISSQATITLKANSINDFTSPPLTRTLSVENTGIFHWLDDLSNTAYRYWKFEFADRLNTVGPQGFPLNIAYLGDYVTPLNTNIYNGSLTRQMADASIKQYAVSGTGYYRAVAKRWRFDSVVMDNINQVDRLALEAAYSQIGTTNPFFIALDPTLAWSATAGEMTKYVTFDTQSGSTGGMPVATQVFYQYFKHGFGVQEEV